MAEVLRPTNFDSINLLEKTELTADVAASQKVATVLNPQGIEAQDYYVVGPIGGEKSELAQLDSVSGNDLTALANFALTHKKGDRVCKLFGNKIKIYRAANVDGSIPDDDDFSLIATIDIEVDQQYTEYTDTSGGSGYWYKKTYYNSTSTSETLLADAPAVRGGNYGYYANWEEVRGEAGMTNNKWIPDSVYLEKLQLAQSEVNASIRKGGYTLPLTSVPKIVKNATLLIAAGYVLLRDYGVENTGTNKEGNQKLEQGRKLLLKIESGDEILTDDLTGEALATDGETANRINGWPKDTAQYETPSQARHFKITDKF